MTVRNALDSAFIRAKSAEEGVLIAYLTGGFPSTEMFVDLAMSVLEAGADVLEIGIPFSDPLLDGVAIQEAQQFALDAGVTPATCLEYARRIRARSDKPLLFMGAFNPILAYGVERFSRDAAEAGVNGLIVPDLPLEEQDELRPATMTRGLHLIQLVAPTSTPERLQRVCATASGFIYAISVAGVTGARLSVVETAGPLVERIRAYTDVPVAVGFGIATPEQAREVADFAEGVIVGSALITTVRVLETGSPDAAKGASEKAARDFIGSLKAAMMCSKQARLLQSETE
jgi:tryptophan synthase alpha chain